MRVSHFIVLLLLFLSLSATANADLKSDGQLWVNAFFAKQVAPLRFYFEFEPRFRENFSERNQIVVRPHLEISLHENHIIAFGYAWLPSFEEVLIHEHRIVQDYIFRKNWGDFGFSQRLRLLERFFPDTPMYVTIREMIDGRYHFLKSKRLFGRTYVEAFFNLHKVDNGPKSGFAQFRYYLGPGYYVDDTFTFELGYQPTLFKQEGDDLLAHVIMARLTFEL